MADKGRAGDGKSKSQAKTERDERLAKALRDNLAKRKAQSRLRTDDPGDKKQSS